MSPPFKISLLLTRDCVCRQRFDFFFLKMTDVDDSWDIESVAQGHIEVVVTIANI